jgi:ribosome-binding factor A
MASRKLDHLNERVRHKLGLILERESGDPRFRHVTITGVQLSRDLAHARVSFATYERLLQPKTAAGAPGRTARGGTVPGAARGKAGRRPVGDLASLTEALNRAAGYFSHAVARTLETRVSPKLTFVYDPTFDRVQEMENLLKPLRQAGEMGHPEDSAPAEAADAEHAP